MARARRQYIKCRARKEMSESGMPELWAICWKDFRGVLRRR